MSLTQYVPAHIRAIAPYQPGKPISELAREMGLREADIVKLASNENPLGMSPLGRQAMARELDALALYPDGNGFGLKSALAAKLVVGKDSAGLPLSAESEAKDLLTPDQAAALLSVSVDWMYRHAAGLPFTRRLSRKALRFSKAGLLRWRAGRRLSIMAQLALAKFGGRSGGYGAQAGLQQLNYQQQLELQRQQAEENRRLREWQIGQDVEIRKQNQEDRKAYQDWQRKQAEAVEEDRQTRLKLAEETAKRAEEAQNIQARQKVIEAIHAHPSTTAEEADQIVRSVAEAYQLSPEITKSIYRYARTEVAKMRRETFVVVPNRGIMTADKAVGPDGAADSRILSAHVLERSAPDPERSERR